MLPATLKKPTLLIVALLLLGHGFAVPPAHADPPPWAQKKEGEPDRERDRERDRQPRAEAGITLDEAVNRAQRRYGARVIRAETHVSNGRRIHQLRLLSDDGRVWTVRIDAATGAEL